MQDSNTCHLPYLPPQHRLKNLRPPTCVPPSRLSKSSFNRHQEQIGRGPARQHDVCAFWRVQGSTRCRSLSLSGEQPFSNRLLVVQERIIKVIEISRVAIH